MTLDYPGNADSEAPGVREPWAPRLNLGLDGHRRAMKDSLVSNPVQCGEIREYGTPTNRVLGVGPSSSLKHHAAKYVLNA